MSLAYYYGLLQKKQSDLQRLQICKGQLIIKKGEFLANTYLMTKPELTSSTWQGQLARQFETIRIDGILASYQEIQSSQFNQVFSVLSSKMYEIAQEIEAIKQTIALLEEEARQAAREKTMK